jgi:hypothetical protein
MASVLTAFGRDAGRPFPFDLFPPSFSFPVHVFDHLEYQSQPAIHCFPRVSKWVPFAIAATGRMASTECLLFALIQELILTGNPDLGDMVVKVADHLPNGLLDFEVWFDFVREAAFRYPQLLVFILGIVRPAIFRRAEGSRYQDVLSILIASLLCDSVYNSPKLSAVLTALKKYLRERDRITAPTAVEAVFASSGPAQLLEFDAVFPLEESALPMIEGLAVLIICEYLNEEFDLALNFEIQKKFNELVLAGEELRASVIITMILKWVIVKVRKGQMTVGSIQSLRDRLNFEIALPFGEAMLLKEKLKIAQVQFEQIHARIARQPP